jgi:hypothetical protein
LQTDVTHSTVSVLMQSFVTTERDGYEVAQMTI